MGAAGEDKVYYVGYWNVNNPKFVGADFAMGYDKKYKDDYYTMATYTGIRFLAKAFKETKSTDPVKVAKAIEGMKVESLNGEVEMRKTDHQAQQQLTSRSGSRSTARRSSTTRRKPAMAGRPWRKSRLTSPPSPRPAR